MNSKVIFYCFLLYCFKYVASTPFSEDSIRQTTFQPDNWQSDENINESSWNQDTDVSRTQNINSMTHSARRQENNNEYKANSESHHENFAQNKHEQLPMESLPIQEEPSDLQIDPNTFPTRTNNQHYRQHNSQYHSPSSPSRSGNNNYRTPVIPAKQKPYHIANRDHREPIHHNRGNQRHFNDDTLRPVPKYNGNVRRMNPIEINSRSQNSGESLDSYSVAHATAQATNYNRNRYIENSPPHSGPSYLPPQNHHGAKKEGYYYNNERNRHLARSQNHPSYNNQGRYLEVDNFGNPKYSEYPQNSRPKHFNKPRHDSYVNRYEEIADNNENSSSSGSVANAKSFQDESSQSGTTSNHKNISENTKGKKKSRGPKFMIIHKNGTVEYIDHIDDKPKYSIVGTGDKTKHKKDVATQNDNGYHTASSHSDSNSENAPAKSSDQFTSSDGTTGKALAKDSSERVEETSDSSKSNDNQYVAPSGNDNNSKRPGERERQPSPPPSSDSNRHHTSTLSPEEKEVQEYLDSLTNNNDDKASQKSALNTQKSTQEYQEDGSMQEFLDSLSKKSNSNHQSPNEDNERDEAQESKSDSNGQSTTTTVSPAKTTASDEIITLSPIETSTENVRNQSSEDSITKLTNKDTKTNDDGEAKSSDNSKSTKTNDDSSKSSKDSDKKCHHHPADSDCLTNIDAPTDNDESTTETVDTDEQSDVKKSNESVTVNDLKLILDIPNNSTGTLKLVLNLPDNTGKEGTTDEEKLKINVDTKEYRESNSGANKKDEKNDDSKEKSSTDKDKDKDKNTLNDLINSITAWNKTTDKDFIKQLPSDNSTVNLWYLIQMQPQCLPIVEKSKVTTIYPNGTIVEELTETTRQNKDDDEPTVVKTTKISHKDHKKH